MLGLLGKLLRGRRQRGSLAFSDLRHDRDLVPGVTSRLQSLIDHTDVRRHVIADVQGPRDEGGDVIIRLTADDSRPAEYFVFQIKAHDELGHSGIVDTLRTQYFRAEERYYPMVRYIIMPFGVAESVRSDTDGSPVLMASDRRQRVREIQSAFSGRRDTIVVEPQFLAGFWALNGTRIDAFVRSVLGEDDAIWRAAASDLSGLSASQVALVLLVASENVSSDRQVTLADVLASSQYRDGLGMNFAAYESGSLRTAYDRAELLQDAAVDDAIASDLDAISDFIASEGDFIRFRTAESPGVTALLADAVVRFSRRGTDLLDYALWMLEADHIAEED